MAIPKDHTAHILAGQVADAVGGSPIRTGEVVGPHTHDDPRLQAQLEIMRTRCLSQFSMAINGIRLAFWGEEADSISREIHIERTGIGIARDKQATAVLDRDHPVVATTLLASLGAKISTIAVADGRLALTFANGVTLTVDPDDDHESWQISSDDGLLIVCAPGGDLTVWYPAGN